MCRLILVADRQKPKMLINLKPRLALAAQLRHRTCGRPPAARRRLLRIGHWHYRVIR